MTSPISDDRLAEIRDRLEGDDFDHDPGDCCPNCGGDGVVYSCFDECGCVDPESGCGDCERVCDWCKPRRPLPPPPSSES